MHTIYTIISCIKASPCPTNFIRTNNICQQILVVKLDQDFFYHVLQKCSNFCHLKKLLFQEKKRKQSSFPKTVIVVKHLILFTTYFSICQEIWVALDWGFSSSPNMPNLCKGFQSLYKFSFPKPFCIRLNLDTETL